MPESYWLSACTSAVDRPKGTLTIAIGSIVVSCPGVKIMCPCCAALVFSRHFLRLTIHQSTACFLCVVASGCMLWRWWRLDDYDRGRIWKHYGWFCGLMCFGSCAGTVSYAAISSFFDNYYKSFTDEDYNADNYYVYSRVSFVPQLPYNCSAFLYARFYFFTATVT